MASKGTFGDFLNALRAFESGVSEARIEGSRAEVIQQVGQERFDGFEAGDLTLTDLQYSSTNFLGFVGYQFGEPLLIDLGYYELDATPGINDFSGTFTGKNGVSNLDDLKSNVQERIILDEFAFNLARIEAGLGTRGQSLDGFIGREFSFTDVDGSQVRVELSLTGILAAAHLRGVIATLNLLQDGSASADEIGTSILQFVEQFGGFEAPAIAALINGKVPPLVTDSTLRPGGASIEDPQDGEVDAPAREPHEPDAQETEPGDTYGGNDTLEFTEAGGDTVAGAGDLTVPLGRGVASTANVNNVPGVTLPAVGDDGDQLDVLATVFPDDGFLS